MRLSFITCVTAVQVPAGNSVHILERFYFIVLSQGISRKFGRRRLNSRSARSKVKNSFSGESSCLSFWRTALALMT